jgi:hypothetical protein
VDERTKPWSQALPTEKPLRDSSGLALPLDGDGFYQGPIEPTGPAWWRD